MKSLRAPLLLFVLPAVLVALVPMSHRLLVLDRHALAAGEIWRLWTGHWVHFSASHLGWNLAVLVAAGTWLERLHPGRLLRHTLVAAPLIGSAVLAGEPGLDFYGGLSGLATGVVVLLALPQVRTPGAGRWLWAGVLALVALKLVRDQVAPAALFADLGTSGARASTTAHAAGAVAALLHHALNRWQEWRQGAPTPQVAPQKNGTAGTRDGFPAARFRSLPLTTGSDTQTYCAPFHRRVSHRRHLFHFPRRNVTENPEPEAGSSHR